MEANVLLTKEEIQDALDTKVGNRENKKQAYVSLTVGWNIYTLYPSVHTAAERITLA